MNISFNVDDEFQSYVELAKLDGYELRIDLNINSTHFPRLDYFKMSEMRATPERLQLAEMFYRIIERHVSTAMSCVINIESLIRAVDSIYWPSWVTNPDSLKNPYFFAFKAIVDVFSQKQKELGIDEKVDFIFDENKHESKKVLENWDWLKVGSKSEFRNFMGNKPQYKDDKEALPLQASDMYANWVWHWETKGVADGVEKLRFAWEPKRDIPRLSMHFSEDDIRTELLKGFSPEAIRRAGFSKEEVRKILED